MNVIDYYNIKRVIKMSDNIIFNKDLLLSSKSPDEFNLHLPNPKTLICNLIEKDDITNYKKLLRELFNIMEQLRIIPRMNLEKLSFLSELIVKNNAFNIIMWHLIENDLYDDSFILKLVAKYKHEFNLNQQMMIKYLMDNNAGYNNNYGDNIVPDDESIESCKQIIDSIKNNNDENESKNILLTLDELYERDIDIYVEYIKYIMELFSQLDYESNTCYSFNEHIDKTHTFHDFVDGIFINDIFINTKKLKIASKLVPYMKSDDWSLICNQKYNIKKLEKLINDCIIELNKYENGFGSKFIFEERRRN